MELSLGVAFIAGIVSFLAPCILPIIPGFLLYLAGSAGGVVPSRREVFLNSLCFVAGFSAVFAILGILLNSLLEAVAYDVSLWLSRVGGVVIIFFGLYLVGLLKIPFLEREHKIQIVREFKSRYLTSLVFGAAFAAGWTPCVGPALGAILGLAATAPGSAFSLLLSYALGLAFPFLLVGLFAGEATELINRNLGKIRYVNIIFGAVLIILGFLVFTQRLSMIADFEFVGRLLR